MLIELEADHGMAAKSGSLMDSVLMGMVSSCRMSSHFSPKTDYQYLS